MQASIRSVSNTDRQCNPRLFGDGFVPVMLALEVGRRMERQERKLPASDKVIGHIVAMHLPRLASNANEVAAWTTRVSAPDIDSSVGALSAVKCPSRYPCPWDCPRVDHWRVAGSSRALHLMHLRVVVLLARLLLLLLVLVLPLPLPLPGSVRLGSTTHSSSTAGIAGLCCALPCLALLHCYLLGLLLPWGV
jgi:hypothetical protein